MDGEQPLVITSKHTVSNTVTAPDDYLSLLQPSEKASAARDTNTYYSTVALEKTLYEGDKSQIVSTDEVVTQVVITESVPARVASVMTSYIALDVEDLEPQKLKDLVTTDVVKTYYVTYTYYDTTVSKGNTVVNTNISTSTDVVTEKLFLHSKRNKETNSIINTSPIVKDNKKKPAQENFDILVEKTYLTTFTYYTTLLQDDSSTVINSNSKVVENVVTETIEPTLLNKKYLKSLRKEIREGSGKIIKLATLNDGEKIEITAVPKDIKPTKVLPIEKTTMPEMHSTIGAVEIDPSTPSVITGSTIIFADVDDDPFAAALAITPSLVANQKNEYDSLLSSEMAKKQSQASKPSSKLNTKRSSEKIRPTNVSAGNVKNTNKLSNRPAGKQSIKSTVKSSGKPSRIPPGKMNFSL